MDKDKLAYLIKTLIRDELLTDKGELYDYEIDINKTIDYEEEIKQVQINFKLINKHDK